FFFSSRRRHTRFSRDWSSDVCSSDLDSPRNCTISCLRLAPRESRAPTSFLRCAERDVPIDMKLIQAISKMPNAMAMKLYMLEIRSEERRVGKECRSQC